MSLDYTLVIETTLEPDQMAQIIANATDLVVQNEYQLAGTAIDMLIRAETARGQEMIADAFGFRPTLHLNVRINPNVTDEDYVEAKRRLIHAVLAVLNHDAGNAVLLANNEQVVLQRINNVLTLNQQWREWETYRLMDAVSMSYRLLPLPSPLL